MNIGLELDHSKCFRLAESRKGLNRVSIRIIVIAVFASFDDIS